MKKFIHDFFNQEEANVIVFGVALGKNSKKMLSSLREVNWFVESFDLEKKTDPLEKIRVCDIGNIKIKELDDIFKKTYEVVSARKVPLILGKSHLLTLYSLGGIGEGVKVIVFDAHADLANEYMDEKIAESVEGVRFEDSKRGMARFNSFTWLRRFCEQVGTRDICLIGVRACTEEEFKFIEENKILYFTPTQIRKNLKEVKKKLKRFIGDSKVYVSLDMDVFDPSIAPAVDHPIPNGLFFCEFLEIIEALKGRIIGLDLVEISPIEGNKVTEFLAVKAVFELLGNIKVES